MRCVMILLDSLNRRHLKAYNPQSRAITPNINQFASESIRFDNHFIGSAPCMPARRDIWTGRLSFLERGWGPIEPFDVTLPQTIRKENVLTHIVTDHNHYFEIGGENYPYLFDTWQFERGQEYDAWISHTDKPQVDPESYGKKSSQYLSNRSTFHDDSMYPTPKTFRSACEWADMNAESDNFFLMVECFDPHEPFDAPIEFHEEYDKEFQGREFNWSSYAPVTEPPEALERLNNCYMATLTMTDKWFGYFLHTLRKNKLYDDTLIILTADHGHLLGEHGFTGKNFMHAYNELAHIPLFIKLPDGSRAGENEIFLTQNIDIMPTLLDFLIVIYQTELWENPCFNK
jgi:arylsulfatase A-like enzyme